jgi:hypothetical protein
MIGKYWKMCLYCTCLICYYCQWMACVMCCKLFAVRELSLGIPCDKVGSLRPDVVTASPTPWPRGLPRREHLKRTATVSLVDHRTTAWFFFHMWDHVDWVRLCSSMSCSSETFWVPAEMQEVCVCRTQHTTCWLRMFFVQGGKSHCKNSIQVYTTAVCTSRVLRQIACAQMN